MSFHKRSRVWWINYQVKKKQQKTKTTFINCRRYDCSQLSANTSFTFYKFIPICECTVKCLLSTVSPLRYQIYAHRQQAMAPHKTQHCAQVVALHVTLLMYLNTSTHSKLTSWPVLLWRYLASFFLRHKFMTNPWWSGWKIKCKTTNKWCNLLQCDIGRDFLLFLYNFWIAWKHIHFFSCSTSSSLISLCICFHFRTGIMVCQSKISIEISDINQFFR